MPTTWIVVADASRARVIERRGDSSTEIADLLNPEGRAHARDIGSDANGRFPKGGSNTGPGHAAGPDTDPVEHAVSMFAKRVARSLDEARVQGRYQSLCLVAPPKMLGLLRAELPTEVARRVVQEVGKDLSALDVRELVSRIDALSS